MEGSSRAMLATARPSCFKDRQCTSPTMSTVINGPCVDGTLYTGAALPFKTQLQEKKHPDRYTAKRRPTMRKLIVEQFGQTASVARK